jgi:MFS family permease
MIVVGAVLMGCGHGFLSLHPAFLFGMGLIALGNGCFKPNISTRVGSLYAAKDTRRDAAFSIFYCGINLGAMLAPLVAGSLRVAVGYEAGFASASVGMVICLATYLGFQWVIRDSLKRRLLGWDGGGPAGAEAGDVDGEIGGEISGGGGGGVSGDVDGGGVRKPVDFRKVAAQHKSRIAAILVGLYKLIQFTHSF